MLIDKGDILIELKKKLRNSNSDQLTVIFEDTDLELGLASGSTKEHIKEAAGTVGYNVDDEGATRIHLSKNSTDSGPTTSSVPTEFVW